MVDVGDGEIVGEVLTSAAADFAGAGVDAGSVVVVNGVVLEVIERIDAGSLRVSLVRDALGDPVRAPSGVTGARVVAPTFGPQVAFAHAIVMRSLGLAVEGEGSPDASNVMNKRAIGHVEALGALAQVYGAASARAGADDALWARAEMYQRRLATARLDLDGDGVVDATRRAGQGVVRRR